MTKKMLAEFVSLEHAIVKLNIHYKPLEMHHHSNRGACAAEAAVLLAIVAMSCGGGGGGGGGGTTTTPGTPAGTYKLTVTGVSGNLQHGVLVTLSVK